MNLKETKNLINKSIRDLDAYHLEPEPAPVKLNQNESPFDWPQKIKEDVSKFCMTRPWNRYPDFIPKRLKTAVAEYTGLSPENVIIGNGSNEMLQLILISLTEQDSPVIICQPTFTVYQLLVKGLGRKLCETYLNQDLTYNIKSIIEKSSEFTGSLIILASPNNPTGTSLTESGIRKILDTHDGFLLLDQAYTEFGGFNALSLLDEYPNLIITRTFSKAFQCAGIRAGYMVGNAEIIKEINKIKLPYNINFFTEYTVTSLLAQKIEMETAVKCIISERDKMSGFLKTLPLENIYPSSANFILIRTEKNKTIFEYLKKNGILLRDVSSYPMLENCLRISIGTEEENRLLKENLNRFFIN